MKKSIIILLVFFLFTGCGSTEYVIEFNSNGGSLVEEQKVERGSNVTKPVDPTKEGYNFQYWESNNKKYNFADKVQDNLILEAKWNEVNIKTYKVIFNNEGSTKEVEVNEGTSVLEPEKPEKNGYIFLGWYNKDDEEPYDFEKIVTDNFELKAKFEQKDYVSSSSKFEETIFVTNIEAKVEKAEIQRKETVKIEVDIEPKNASDKSVKYSSSNSKVASVDQNGVIKGLRAGEVEITISSKDTSNIQKKIKINVTK